MVFLIVLVLTEGLVEREVAVARGIEGPVRGIEGPAGWEVARDTWGT